jgi:hypothetical protein
VVTGAARSSRPTDPHETRQQSVNGEVHLRKRLTEPTLLEMAGYPTNQELAKRLEEFF